MVRIRHDAWKLGTPWNDTMLWYARAVEKLQTRPLTDPTSWGYLAAMHGYDEALWRPLGYVSATNPAPSQAVQDDVWIQCQHFSWYFLPWHRGYLSAFEQIVRAAIVELGGPAQWALPYWDYNDQSNPKARSLPPCFWAKKLPDGSKNPLLVAQRFGGTATSPIDPAALSLSALQETDFASATSPAMFGGSPTVFSHGDGDGGQLEDHPHGTVHVAVARGKTSKRGLMGSFDTAALDPIFWLHHANIDRLWEVWLARAPGNHNPVEPEWLDGPPLLGRRFKVPMTNGQLKTFTARDVLDTRSPQLDYEYESIADPLGGSQRQRARLHSLGRFDVISANRAVQEREMLRPASRTELMGANDQVIHLPESGVETRVRLDKPSLTRMSKSFALRRGAVADVAADEAVAASEPDRVFLNLENVRCDKDGAMFYVYVNLPQGADPGTHPQNLAGTFSLFGVSKASRANDAHGGSGVTKSIEITHLVDALHLTNQLDREHIDIRFVAATGVADDEKISVGRVSVSRLSQQS